MERGLRCRQASDREMPESIIPFSKIFRGEIRVQFVAISKFSITATNLPLPCMRSELNPKLKT